MQSSARRQIQFPTLVGRPDAPDIPQHITNIIQALDADVVWGQGAFAQRPTSSPSVPGFSGRFYWSSDLGQLDLDFGTGWATIFPQSGVSVPIGGAIDWDYAASGIPSWALLQYGQAVSRSAYATLHALAVAAGYPHGSGDNVSTFNIADKRGRASAGKDDMGGVAANRITAAVSGAAGTTLGAVVGTEGVTLTTGQMPSHNHPVTGAPSVNDPGHGHVTNIGYQGLSGVGTGPPSWLQNTQGNPGGTGSGVLAAASSGAVTGVTVGIGSLAAGAAGGGQAHLNMQPTIIVNKILRVL